MAAFPGGPAGTRRRGGVRGPRTLGPDGRVWPEATASWVRVGGRVTAGKNAASEPCLGERVVTASAGPPWVGRQQLGRQAPGSRLGRRRKDSSAFTPACAASFLSLEFFLSPTAPHRGSPSHRVFPGRVCLFLRLQSESLVPGQERPTHLPNNWFCRGHRSSPRGVGGLAPRRWAGGRAERSVRRRRSRRRSPQ